MKIESWITGSVLVEGDFSSLAELLADAARKTADLTGAYLTGADLTGAYLTGADLTEFRDDVWAVLSAAPAEVMALRSAIIEGRIDGSVYEGDCACLVGTLEKYRPNDSVEIGLRRDSSRLAERWFLRIEKGNTPENDWTSKVTLEWVDQWIANVRGAVEAWEETEAGVRV